MFKLIQGARHLAVQRSSKQLYSRIKLRAYTQRAVPLKQLSESFVNGTSANYVEQMYEAWKEDPESVHVSWKTYFSNVEKDVPAGDAFALPPSLGGEVSFQAEDSRSFKLGVKVQQLIRAYQVMGHNKANLDPLGLMERPDVKELNLESYGLTESDLDTVVNLESDNITYGFLTGKSLTVRQIVDALKDSYCNTMGIEYMHIQDRQKCNWLRERIENRKNTYVVSKEDRKNLYDRLAWASLFEQYLQKKFTEKRFGCDGGEVMIPGLKTLVDYSADLGVEDIVFGMAHRGRLNVLANVLRKPYSKIFHEFTWGTTTRDDFASGDVKYHLGTSYDRPTRNGKNIHLCLVANPSHLEAVNPVVEGKVAAKQYYSKDKEQKKVMAVLIHGDASFVGQGVVYESIQMSGLPKYTTGGTLHVIINNQIGFTTDPVDSRPGQYCTDVMKSAGAPIFHVNADDPDMVIWVMKLAVEYRQTFHDDVVVDIICYRRHGHNEIDQPKYTQPLLYQTIDKHPTTLDIYAKKLVAEGVASKEEINDMNKAVLDGLEKHFEEAKNPDKSGESTINDWLSSRWEGFKGPKQLARIKNTGITNSLFDQVARALYEVPQGFTLHPNLSKMMQQKKEMLTTGQDIDWATAEALAFGSLLVEGFHVRLSGQDVERGTFSHRHAVLHDQKTGQEYVPLNNIPEQKSLLSIKNSFLSEYAALGYELGFSLEDPNALIMWEAQFGDFANGAQIIIDQFISSGEQKWMRQSGLTLLLPHGFEGQGPEHSSARLERFLQMSDQDLDNIPPMDINHRTQIQRSNWQIVNCTTPANYFHVLRRQLHREFRKPLIVFTPKSLLRHPLCKSPRTAFDDVGDDTRFIRLYPEVDQNLLPNNDIKRVIFCTGKVYYDLYEERKKLGVKDVVICRVEQLAPFPFDHVAREISNYPNAQVTWVQEEPKNMGAYTFCYFNLKTTLRSLNDKRNVHYIGRPSSASPATGSNKIHVKEQAKLVSDALTKSN
eukprot:TRINITY_DN125_c0_g2_i1.p1 TRINITY_DN125_c0_g2~~TRINITY_DN125_c0_g2_i1.p1  ORF type:complete len:997 (-),score=267.81 TRINITY_DN125_c0_g2_i1:88-3078(-)